MEEQFEEDRKTYLKVGWCIYCGNPHTTIEYRERIPQSILNNKAFYACDCEDAVADRKQRRLIKQKLEDEGRYDLARQLG